MLKEEVKQVIHVIYGNGSDKDKEAVDSITSATWNAISEALTDQIVAMGVLTWEGQSFIMHKTEEAPTIDYGISGFGKRKDGDKEVTYTFTIRVEGGFPGLVLGLLISCFLGWCCYRCIRLFTLLDWNKLFDGKKITERTSDVQSSNSIVQFGVPVKLCL